MPRLKQRYEKEIAAALQADLKVKNKAVVPRVEKIIISMGLGKAIAEKPRLEAAIKELTRSPARRP